MRTAEWVLVLGGLVWPELAQAGQPVKAWLRGLKPGEGYSFVIVALDQLGNWRR